MDLCLHDCFKCEIEQTTLLNHILTAEHGKRIAVIENEVRPCESRTIPCLCRYGCFF